MHRIRVERRDRVEVECAGIKIKINMLVAVKWLYPTGESIPATNGYQDYSALVFEDYQGRRWVRRETIDFYSNIYYAHKMHRLSNYTPQPYDKYFGVLASKD